MTSLAPPNFIRSINASMQVYALNMVSVNLNAMVDFMISIFMRDDYGQPSKIS